MPRFPCKCLKPPKKIPYGQKRNKVWCYKCDGNQVPDNTQPIKKIERRKAKINIKKELDT